MTDCILALQQCSLIGLDDSPDLLRHSILHRDGSENVLLWNSKEVRNHVWHQPIGSKQPVILGLRCIVAGFAGP